MFMLENTVSLEMLNHYEHLLLSKPDFDGIKEPMAFFIPRIDAFLSLKEHVTGRDPKQINLSKCFSGDLLTYLRSLRDFGFIGNYGGSVDVVRYILKFTASNLNLVWIPKNSCTYLKTYFLQFEAEDTRQKIKKNRFHESCQDQFGMTHNEPFDYSREYLAIIRHPVERFVSCYLDKFVKPVLANKPFEDFIRGHIKLAQKVINLPNADMRRSLTFSEFLYYVSKQPMWSYDAHWRPQNQFLRNIPKLNMLTINQFNKYYIYQDEYNKNKANVTFGKKFSLAEELSGEYADLLPSDIGKNHINSYNQFVSKIHYLMLSDIYVEDMIIVSKIDNP